MLTVFTSLACFPGRTSRISGDCHPRTTWRPLTLFWATQFFLLCVSLEVFATSTGRYHGRMLNHPSSPACATLLSRCLHTRRFGTLASPPPPVMDMPWGPHLPGHLSKDQTSLEIHRYSNNHQCASLA